MRGGRYREEKRGSGDAMTHSRHDPRTVRAPRGTRLHARSWLTEAPPRMLMIRQVAKDVGLADAFAFPGFVPAYTRPLFCRGVGPFRRVALSGDPEDKYRTDAKVKESLPGDTRLHRWLDLARARSRFQGLPARLCWVGLRDRQRLGLAFNEMVASGESQAPVVIGSAHPIWGAPAAPNRETEAMRDGSDAVSSRPPLNAHAPRRRRASAGARLRPGAGP